VKNVTVSRSINGYPLPVGYSYLYMCPQLTNSRLEDSCGLMLIRTRQSVLVWA
jgi:hypothetical protein